MVDDGFSPSKSSNGGRVVGFILQNPKSPIWLAKSKNPWRLSPNPVEICQIQLILRRSDPHLHLFLLLASVHQVWPPPLKNPVCSNPHALTVNDEFLSPPPDLIGSSTSWAQTQTWSDYRHRTLHKYYGHEY